MMRSYRKKTLTVLLGLSVMLSGIRTDVFADEFDDTISAM